MQQHARQRAKDGSTAPPGDAKSDSAAPTLFNIEQGTARSTLRKTFNVRHRIQKLAAICRRATLNYQAPAALRWQLHELDYCSIQIRNSDDALSGIRTGHEGWGC